MATSSEIFINNDIRKYNIDEKFINAFYVKIDDDVISFFTKNKNFISKHKFEINSMFVHKYKTWIWGWALPNIHNKLLITSKHLLNYGLDLDPSNDMNKMHLITSRFKIHNKQQIHYLNSLSLNYIKNKSIYELKILLSKDNIDEYKLKINEPITFNNYFNTENFIKLIDDTHENIDLCISYFIYINDD